MRRIIRKAEFEKNQVGRYLGSVFFNSKFWKENKKLTIKTSDHFTNPGRIFKAFNIMLLQLANEGVTQITIIE